MEVRLVDIGLLPLGWGCGSRCHECLAQREGAQLASSRREAIRTAGEGLERAYMPTDGIRQVPEVCAAVISFFSLEAPEGRVDVCGTPDCHEMIERLDGYNTHEIQPGVGTF